MRIRTVFSISLSMIVVGCAIRPLPKNVTRDTTLSIVEKIRCETRKALVGSMITVLEEEYSQTNEDLLAKLYLPGGTSAESLCRLKPMQFDKAARDRLGEFRTSSITYGFEFTITEQKVKSGAASFNLPFTKGSFKLGLSAGSDKMRKNFRKISFGDTFASLLVGRYASGKPTGLNCGSVKSPRKHWIYPITGNIGMSEVMKTYIDLKKATNALKTFQDTLTFTTKFSFGADPSVALDRLIPRKLNLVSASVDYDASRNDIHQVDVTLTTPKFTPATPKTQMAIHSLFKEQAAGDNPPTDGMPKGSEFGIMLKTIKIPQPKPEPGEWDNYKCDLLQKIETTPAEVSANFRAGKPAPPPFDNAFSISEQEEALTLFEGREEKRRLEEVSRRRSIDLLIRP